MVIVIVTWPLNFLSITQEQDTSQKLKNDPSAFGLATSGHASRNAPAKVLNCKPKKIDVIDAGHSSFLHERHLLPVTSCVMATPSLVQIDDRDPLVFYSPNNSWTRGGATSDFNGTSTSTATTGASATLTFTGMHLISPAFFFSMFSNPIQRPKAQGSVFGAQFNSCNLMRRHLWCHPIESITDLRRSSTLRKPQDTNSSKNCSNLLS